MCDNSYGALSCVEESLSNFKLLYDIYQRQINEGMLSEPSIKIINLLVTTTLQVPGRNEIDQTQDLFYPAIIKAIVQQILKDLWLRAYPQK